MGSYTVKDASRPIISLRAVACFSSLASLASYGWAQSLHDTDEVVASDLSHAMLGPVLGAVQYTFAWSLIAISIRMSSPFSLHPAIYVTFDLFAWGALAAGVILYLLVMIPYISGSGYSCGTSYRDDHCKGRVVADVEIFATAMSFVALIIHFGLFVWACRVTDKFRKSLRKDYEDNRRLTSHSA